LAGAQVSSLIAIADFRLQSCLTAIGQIRR